MINQNADFIVLAILGLFIIALVTFVIVLLSLIKTKKRYKTLLKGMKNKNLEEILLINSQKIEKLEDLVKENNNKLDLVTKELESCYKNSALERYNAFQGIGGEQSFSLALLDDNGNGLILTTIHGRDDARTYAKRILAGKSQYNLSEEEKKVLSDALNISRKN